VQYSPYCTDHLLHRATSAVLTILYRSSRETYVNNFRTPLLIAEPNAAMWSLSLTVLSTTTAMLAFHIPWKQYSNDITVSHSIFHNHSNAGIPHRMKTIQQCDYCLPQQAYFKQLEQYGHSIHPENNTTMWLLFPTTLFSTRAMLAFPTLKTEM